MLSDLGRKRSGTGVGDLDADTPGDEGEPEFEVPAGYAAVSDGVGGEFGDDRAGGVGGGAAVRDAPGVELMQGEVTGQAGASGGGAEALDECMYGDGELGGHVPNVAFGGGTSPGSEPVRCGSVRGHTLDSTRYGP